MGWIERQEVFLHLTSWFVQDGVCLEGRSAAPPTQLGRSFPPEASQPGACQSEIGAERDVVAGAREGGRERASRRSSKHISVVFSQPFYHSTVSLFLIHAAEN
jgi:hypothetical protein